MISKPALILLAVLVIGVVAATIYPIMAHSRSNHQRRYLNTVKGVATAVIMYEDTPTVLVEPRSTRKTNTDRHTPGPWTNLMVTYREPLRRAKTVGLRDYRDGTGPYSGIPTESNPGGEAAMRIDYGYDFYLSESVTHSQVRYQSLTMRVTESGLYDYDAPNLPRGIQYMAHQRGSVFCPTHYWNITGSTMSPLAPGWQDGYDTIW